MNISKAIIPIGIAILGVAGLIFYQHHKINSIKQERDTYQNNTYGLLSNIEELKKDSAMQAYQIQTLSLSVGEYKTYRAEDLKVIEQLNLKIKQVSSVSKQELEVQAPVNAPVVEKIVYRDSIPVKMQTVSFENEHISFNGSLQNDSLVAQINIPIKLTQVLHKVPKHKFLWWSWGCKAVKQVVITDNPYVNLKYSEYIEISK